MLKKSKSKIPQQAYRKIWPADLHPAEIELACFRMGHSVDKGGLGRFTHFKRAAMYHMPSLFEKTKALPEGSWNPWLEDQTRSLCNDDYAVKIEGNILRFVSWTGCGAAGKTFAAGFFSYAWWAADPKHSSVTLTSTSKTAIGQRVWPVIQKLHSEWIDPWTGQPNPVGHIVDSQKKLQAEKGDDKHAIHALAVEKGELLKAINGIKGRHTQRMLLVIDELNTSPAALMDCIRNMAKGCSELIVLFIGNAISKFDLHGIVCEPKDGWGSVTIKDTFWETKGVPSWDVESGLCLHFDGWNSPNVMRKKTLWPFLYSYENFLKAQGKPQTIQYWSQERGFWPLEGTSNTVMNEVMIQKYDGRGKFVFYSQAMPIAFMDPAFGGNRCMLCLGRMGDIGDGKMGIQIDEEKEFIPDVDSLDESDYQIAKWFIEECKRNGVEPEQAGIDATGIGRGVYGVVAHEWSNRVHRSDWGAGASTMPASTEDPRPAKEVYDRKVTELYWSAREILTAGQLKGMTVDQCIDLCTREYEMAGKIFKLDKKEDYKAKCNRSPDSGDALVGMCDIARRNGLIPANKIEGRKSRDWDKVAEANDEAMNDNYSEQTGIEESEAA